MGNFYNVLDNALHSKDNTKADLDPDTLRLRTDQLPLIQLDTYLGEVADEATMLLLGAGPNDFVIRTDRSNNRFVVTGVDGSVIEGWTEIASPNGVISTQIVDSTVAGRDLLTAVDVDEQVTLLGIADLITTHNDDVDSHPSLDSRLDSLETVSASSGTKFFYFKPSVTSDTLAYKVMSGSPSAGPQQTIVTTVTGTSDILVEEFITDAGEPGVTLIPAGTAARNIFFSNDASNGIARFKVDFYKRTTGGVETLLRSGYSGPAQSTDHIELLWTHTDANSYVVNESDRVVVRLYVARVNGPSSFDVTTYFEGPDHQSSVRTTISVSNAQVRSALLTGFTATPNSPILATDTVLIGFNKTQAQIDDILVNNTGDQDLSGLMVKANNLSDLTNAATARTNLGLGTLATQSGTFSGTSSGTNTGDQDLSGLMVKANNLSDLTNAATARTNLGLGTLATQSGTFSGTSSGTNTGDQDLSGLMVKANNLSDLTDAATARTNIGIQTTINTVAGTTYTILDSDIPASPGIISHIVFTSGSAVTVTTNISNTRTGKIEITQLGAGQVTFAGSVYPAGIGLTGKSRSQYSGIELVYYAASTAPILKGDMA